MNGREFYHESVVKDLVDVLTSLKDFDEVQFINNAKANRSFKSITSATKDLILTFPVLVSTDIDPENAIMFAKAHEKKMAQLIHILFTAVSVGNNEDVLDYVKKFHNNVGSMNGTLEDYMDSFDKLANTFGESYDATMKIDKAVLNSVLEDLKESNYVLPDNVRESSLESYKIVPGYRTGMKDMVLKEARMDHMGNIEDITNQRDADATTARLTGYPNTSSIPDNISVGDTLPNGQTVDQITMDNINMLKGYTNSAGDPTTPANHITRHGFQNDVDKAKYMKDMVDYHNSAILNAEYKKANELQATTMVINFMRHSENGDYLNTAVIGIKAKIYAVDSADICNRVSGKLDDKNVLTNFVRATTNEIAFFRDFLFAVDNAKLDAMSYGKKATSNKLWKVLERRSIKSKFRRSLKMYNDATAISSLVLSENDAEYMKKMYSIDITNVAKARKILDSYNFMCLAVLNQSTEVASILYDTGDDTFEMIPFSGLEREASDNSYKKMVNLLSKVSR